MSSSDITAIKTKAYLFLGAGGVGKTTLAAASAMALAQAGQRCVVLTIDPARRLAQALGLSDHSEPESDEIDDDAVLIENYPSGGELWAAMLNPSLTFTKIVEQGASDSTTATRILNNQLFQNLSQFLSGTSEYMALERLYWLVTDQRFDVVIIDTPPARHAMDFLDTPRRLVNFIDHPLYRTVLSSNSSPSLMIGPQRLAIQVLQKVVGTELVADVMELLSNLGSMDKEFRRRALIIEQLLSSPRCEYLLAATPRHPPIEMLETLAGQLQEYGVEPKAVIFNRSCPIKTKPSGKSKSAAEQNLAQLSGLALLEQNLIDEAMTRLETATVPTVITIDERSHSIQSLEQLRPLAVDLAGLVPD